MSADEPTGADPATMLLELGQAVARAATIDDMIRVVVNVAGPVLGATNATALLMDEARSELIVYHGPAATTGTVRVVALTDPTPAAAVARTEEPVFLENIEELTAAYPRFVEQLQLINWAALAGLPLRAGGELIGVVIFRWKQPVAFTPERRELLTTATELLAHALARAQNHDRLLAFARRISESNRDLESFAAAVAHDLRQPLRQIGAYIDLLLEHIGSDGLDTEASHYADRITAAVGRADSLIIALLEYARAGGKPLAKAEVALGQLVDDVVDVLGPQLLEAGASVHHQDLPIVQGDPDLLRQVIQNLLDNAAKYREPSRPARIVVSATCEERGDDRWWQIAVEDNGVGIPAEHLVTVFDVFTRAHAGEGRGGAGIGLASAKRIIERHEGAMWVESTPGRGSTFFFTLPGVAGRHVY